MSQREPKTALYKAGMALKDAAFSAAPKSLLDAYMWAEKRRNAKIAASALDQVPTLRSDSFPLLERKQMAEALGVNFDELDTNPFYNRDRSKYRRTLFSTKPVPSKYVGKICDALLAQMREDKFLAFGYALPRMPGDRPRRVPDDVIHSYPRVDWAASKISGNGLSFVAVRVVPAVGISMQVPQAAPTGRPSRKLEIQTAYTALRETAAITPGHNPKDVSKMIHAELKTGGERGLGHKTIWRHVKALHDS